MTMIARMTIDPRGLARAAASSLAIVLTPATAQVQSAAVLPEPLTLEFVLSIAGVGHPDLLEREAELARSRAALVRIGQRVRFERG